MASSGLNVPSPSWLDVELVSGDYVLHSTPFPNSQPQAFATKPSRKCTRIAKEKKFQVLVEYDPVCRQASIGNRECLIATVQLMVAGATVSKCRFVIAPRPRDEKVSGTILLTCPCFNTSVDSSSIPEKGEQDKDMRNDLRPYVQENIHLSDQLAACSQDLTPHCVVMVAFSRSRSSTERTSTDVSLAEFRIECLEEKEYQSFYKKVVLETYHAWTALPVLEKWHSSGDI